MLAHVKPMAVAHAPRFGRQRGSSSLLFIAVLLPVLLFFITITLEIHAYSGVRDDVQGIADKEAMIALRTRRSNSETESSVRASLRSLQPLVKLTEVSSQKTNRAVDIHVAASYELSLSTISSSLFAQVLPTVPLVLDARARRGTLNTALIFDRRVSSSGSECGDPDVQAIKAFVAEVQAGYQALGASTVLIAAFPGSQSSLAIVHEGDPSIVTCPSAGAGALVEQVGGVPDSSLSSFDLGLAVQELLASGWGSAQSERWDVVFVSNRAFGTVPDGASVLSLSAGDAIKLQRRIDAKWIRVNSKDAYSHSGGAGAAAGDGLFVHALDVAHTADLAHGVASAVVASNAVSVVSW